jgi:hypothetical protein
MGVVASVLRCGFLRKDFVVSHVVDVYAIARRASNDRRIYPQIADRCGHCDVNDIIAKTASVRRAPGNRSSTDLLVLSSVGV